MKTILFILSIMVSGLFSQDIHAQAECTEANIGIPETYAYNAKKPKEFKLTLTNIKNTKLTIYDRWGNRLFECSIDANYMQEHIDEDGNKTRVYATGWDGMYKEKPLEAGMYSYFVEGNCIEGNRVKKSGMFRFFNMSAGWNTAKP